MNQGMFFLREMGIKLAAESITREALIRELKNANDSHVSPDTGTINLHASLTIYSQELTVFLGYNNQALISDLTDWYDCRDIWIYRTKNMGTDEIIGVWVNLIGATTPDLLQTALPRDAIGIGLTSRTIFVFEQKKEKTVIAPILTKEELELRGLLIKDLEKICMMAGEFKVTEAFIDAYSPWYKEYSEGPPPFDDYRFSGYFERRPAHLMKLCMICSASRTSEMVIDAVDFNRALNILEMTERKMPYTFSGVGKISNADTFQRIKATIAASGEISFEELLSRFYQDIEKIALDRVVEALEIMKFVKVEWRGKERYIIYTGKQLI